MDIKCWTSDHISRQNLIMESDSRRVMVSALASHWSRSDQGLVSVLWLAERYLGRKYPQMLAGITLFSLPNVAWREENIGENGIITGWLQTGDTLREIDCLRSRYSDGISFSLSLQWNSNFYLRSQDNRSFLYRQWPLELRILAHCSDFSRR